ncbi:MAG: hypothetical protein NTW21_06520 [Verrucomicrobia bacterium]|nr:hypothetical protein [Verrucomicrobiota bacterium]
MSVSPPLAAKNQALCMVSDVYHGLEGVQRGEVAYLRVLTMIKQEQDMTPHRHCCHP